MNLFELGEVTDSEYDKEHSCEHNKHPKFDRIVHCATHQDQPADSWQLHGIHYADEEEVAIGEAEYVGEITYHSMILINFCPFCGEALN